MALEVFIISKKCAHHPCPLFLIHLIPYHTSISQAPTPNNVLINQLALCLITISHTASYFYLRFPSNACGMGQTTWSWMKILDFEQQAQLEVIMASSLSPSSQSRSETSTQPNKPLISQQRSCHWSCAHKDHTKKKPIKSSVPQMDLSISRELMVVI